MGKEDFLRLLLTKFFPFLIYPETGPAVPIKGPSMPLVIVAIINHLGITDACLLPTSCFLLLNNVIKAYILRLLFALRERITTE